MKSTKKLLALLLALAVVCCLLPAASAAEPELEDVAVNAVNFPDDAFRAYVSDKCDSDHDGVLSAAERVAVKNLFLNAKNITDLKGMEFFPALTLLNCSNNDVKALDLSTCTSLTTLQCYRTGLTSLDLSSCTALTELYCFDNKLTELDLSKNPALTELYCYGNGLTALDLSKNPALTQVSCSDNALVTLDLSQNSVLNRLYCHNNPLTALDLSGNTALQYLRCDNNMLSSLDLSQNAALLTLSCTDNSLTALDLSQNTDLVELYCSKNPLTALDLSRNTRLRILYCCNTALSSLDLSQNAAMSQLGCWGTNIDTLNIADCPKLIRAYTGVKEEGEADGLSIWMYYDEDEAYYLFVDLDMEVRTESVRDLGNYTFDLRNGPIDRSINIASDELGLMGLMGNIGYAEADGVRRFNLDQDDAERFDLRFYCKDDKYLARLDPRTNLRGDYTLTISQQIINAAIDGGVDYYSTLTFRFPEELNPFADVAEGKYYYTPVLWACYHDPQITGGTDETHFGPGRDCTREQIVTFLWKAKGAPEPTGSVNPFTDVEEDKYYCKAVLWAVENGVTGGVSDTLFGVGRPCKREQAMTFLWKACGSQAPVGAECPFEDVKADKYYYKAVLWAVENGVTGGVSSTRFGVGTPCTRAQIVSFLYKAMGD